LACAVAEALRSILLLGGEETLEEAVLELFWGSIGELGDVVAGLRQHLLLLDHDGLLLSRLRGSLPGLTAFTSFTLIWCFGDV